MSYGLFSTSQVAPSMTRFCKKLSMKKNVIPPTQARDSQTLPRVVPRAAPSGQPSVKSDCPSLGLEVYTRLFRSDGPMPIVFARIEFQVLDIFE